MAGAIVALALTTSTHTSAAEPTASCPGDACRGTVVEGPDGPYVPVDLEAWSDPADGREAIYVNIPDGACVTVNHDARQIVLIFDDTCK